MSQSTMWRCAKTVAHYLESFLCSNSWFSEMKQFLTNFIPGTTGPCTLSFVIFQMFALSAFSGAVSNVNADVIKFVVLTRSMYTLWEHQI